MTDGPARLIVTGGRSIPLEHAHALYWTLERFHAEHPHMILAHGQCPHPRLEWDEARKCWLRRRFWSADSVADDWAETRVAVVRFPANWNAHGRAAGPLRNEHMVQTFRPTHYIVAPGGRGTADCVERLEKFKAVRFDLLNKPVT